MSAFREAIAREVRKEMLNPEFDTRYGRAKGGGRVFWIKHAGSRNFGQFVKEHPAYDDNVAAVHESFSSAVGAVVANRGDEVRVTSGFSVTLGGVLSLSVSGVRWVGEGIGDRVPSFRVNNSAQHGVALDGGSIEFDNFRFEAPLVDEALSMIRVKGVGCRVENIYGQASGGTSNFVDCIRVISGANDLKLNNIRLFSGDAAVPNSFLSFEGPTSRFTSAGFYTTGSVGTAGVIDASGANVKQAMISDWRVSVGGSGKPAVTLDATKGSGIVTNCHLAGTNTTIADNATFSGDWRLSQVYVSEETGNFRQGALIPAVDAD